MIFDKRAVNKQKILEDLTVRVIIAILIVSFVFVNIPDNVKGENKDFPVAGDREPLKVVWVVATAYSSDIEQTDSSPCIPANGYDLCKHYEEYGFGNTVAANFLPLETQIRLPELFKDKIFVVRDRMNQRYGYGRIDIWMPSREEAKAFGVKYVKMEQFGGGVWRWKMARR